MKNNYVMLVERYEDNYYNPDPGYFYEDKEYEYPTYEKAEKGLWDYVRYLKRHNYNEKYGDYEFIIEKIHHSIKNHLTEEYVYIIEINNENELYNDCWRIRIKKL